MPDLLERARRFARPYRIDHGKRFRMKDVDPDDRGDLTAEDKPRAQEALAAGIQAMTELQERLYAQDRWAVLLVFQAIDAAGKDSAIKHVMSGINPQGCQVFSAYEDMIRWTATPEAPWYVVPADHKWFTRVVVAAAIVDGLASLKLNYPKVSKAQSEEIAAAMKTLGLTSRTTDSAG